MVGVELSLRETLSLFSSLEGSQPFEASDPFNKGLISLGSVQIFNLSLFLSPRKFFVAFLLVSGEDDDVAAAGDDELFSSAFAVAPLALFDFEFWDSFSSSEVAFRPAVC